MKRRIGDLQSLSSRFYWAYKTC
nr:unnamed protein product [Callosobruchus chinensis]